MDEHSPATAADVQAYLRSLDGGWVDRNGTVDTFKAGDPQTVLTGIGVAWMGYQHVLERAADAGCNLLVVHEPIYYNHTDTDPESAQLAAASAKRAFLERTGMVVVRCHDLWDQYPGAGIPDSWAAALNLGEPVGGEQFYRVFQVPEQAARTFAASVATRTAGYGQPEVQLVGRPEKPIRRVVIGTGAITPFLPLIHRYNAELVICTDDGFTYWRDAAYALDADLCAVVVNHAVSEVMGMRSLASVLETRFPRVPVTYCEEGCMFQTVAASV